MKYYILDLEGIVKWMQVASGFFVVDPNYLVEFSIVMCGQ